MSGSEPFVRQRELPEPEGLCSSRENQVRGDAPWLVPFTAIRVGRMGPLLRRTQAR